LNILPLGHGDAALGKLAILALPSIAVVNHNTVSAILPLGHGGDALIENPISRGLHNTIRRSQNGDIAR
jgi:hypothetical protein